MSELGLNLSQEFPKPLTDEVVRAADVVITMGCGDACPIYPGKRYEDWEVEDPAGKSLEEVRRIRDEIDGRVADCSISYSWLATPASRAGVAALPSGARRRGNRHVRARVRRLWRDHGRCEDRCARTGGHRDCLWPCHHDHDLRRRPRFRRSLQPGCDHCLCADAPLSVAACGGVHHGPGGGRARRGRPLAGLPRRLADVGATFPSGSSGQAFLWEAVLTFFLMFVITAVATDTRAVGEAAAIAIGGTVGLAAMVGGPVSGASLNPARSLGPGIVSGDLTRSGSISLRRSSAPRSAL